MATVPSGVDPVRGTYYPDGLDSEKTTDAHYESEKVFIDSEQHSQDVYENEEFTPEETKKLIHRIDRRLVTTLGVMYCISLMDRTNLGAAAIAGMTRDLRLTVPMGQVSRYVSCYERRT